MADTLFSGASDALISLALKTLISEIGRVYGETRGVKKELHKLTQKLSLIQNVLEDAEQKQFQDRAVQEWLWRLRDVAYDAEDLLDEWATKAQKQDHESQSRITQLCKCILPLSKLKFRWYMAKKIKEIKESFDELKEQSSEFHLMERAARPRKEVGESSRDPTDSSVIESDILGRVKDKKKMVELLLNDINYEKNIFVLPIVGMGGLGKTTLAQLVYNDPQVVGHFNLRMWVCVSENFELIRLTRDILESVTRTSINLVTLNPLQESLQEKLKGKKFLLVLDDVWSEDPEKWRRLKGILNCSKGSAIIVTTRIESIASMMGSPSQSYKLEGLSKNHCWSLFEQCAFGGESGEESPNLVTIGKQIVNKCGGLPLAVKALGSLLSSTRDEEEWKIIGDSQILKLPFHETDILPALRLSYDHLPFQLRRCFAYCSIFPKDYVIKKENLIYLWIANDFILPKPSMELEEVGNKIFNELVRRSLLQVEYRDSFGKIITCKMHDLLHDLARYVTGSDFFTLENEGEADGVPKETRHLFFARKSFHKSLYDAHKVRGLLLRTLWRRETYVGLDLNQIVNLRLFRLLDLSRCDIKELPSSIGNLFHLRYLDLSFNGFTTLSESVSGLQNLQTLILSYCEHLTVLPEDMRKMCKLRHLDITGCNQLMAMPNKIGQLTGLRKLSTFIVGEGSDCGISQLGGLNLIRGNLSIRRLERVKNGIHPQEAKLLFNKKNLRVLTLSWNEGLDAGEAIKSEETLNSLQPCEKLEELEIFSYPGNQFSSWLHASLLPNLLRVYLKECNNCQSLPPLGQLPWLKHLRIENMHAVKRIGVDFYGEDKSKSSFPCLQEFTLEGMDNLEEWSLVEDKREVFPRLNELTITNLSYFPEGLLRDCTMLKILNLEKCQNLKTLGRDLDCLVALESLTIELCKEMECLSEEGIRGLRYLRELKIAMCWNLTTISPVLEELPSLKTLYISHCGFLMSLPGGIGKLSHLESLRISQCRRLTSFPQEGIGGFTSLQNLALLNLPNLTSLPEGIGDLVSLKGLQIVDCPKLSNLPATLQRLTALKRFSLSRFDSLDFLPEGGLPSLESLVIENSHNLTTSVLGEGVRRLTALKKLYIISCNEVSSLPAALDRLTSLRELHISECQNLTSLSEEVVRGLTRLEVLDIRDCKKLSSLPAAFQQLTSLRELRIENCENLTSLPEEGVRGLTRLEVLDINDCSKLLSLPAALQQLTSLRELKIRMCENLPSLPEEGVRGLTALEVLALYGCSKLSKLPAALQQLTIQTLDIRGCHPDLITQVERQTGEEWLKIAHIPNIRTRYPGE